MRKSLFVFFCVCVFSGNCIAQNEFRAGYIITHYYDTVKGLVNFPVPLNTTCAFKRHEGAMIENYTPEMIIGYGSLLENRYFASYGIPTPDNKPKQIFAEMLVRGKANLLFYDDFFYIQKDSLKSKIEKTQLKESNSSGGRYVHVHKTYIGILNRYFSDCLPEKLLRGEVDYSENDFVDVFKKYSECQKTDYFVYQPPKESLKLSFNIVVGVNKSKLVYEAAGMNIFKPNTSLFYGAGMEISLPAVSRKVVLTVEATYNHNQYMGKKDGYNSSGTVQNDYTVDIKVIKVPVGLKFNFSDKQFQPYAKAGMTPLFPLRYKWTIEEGGTTEADYIIKGKLASFVLWAGLGFQTKISLHNSAFTELRFEKYQEFIAFHGPGGASNTLSAVFNKMLVFGVRF